MAVVIVNDIGMVDYVKEDDKPENQEEPGDRIEKRKKRRKSSKQRIKGKARIIKEDYRLI